MRLAIFGALPRELKYVIKDLGASRSSEGWPFPVYAAATRKHSITIVQTGMGIGRSVDALNAVLAKERPGLVVSVGFCGALYEQAVAGDLVLASQFLFLKPAMDQNISFSILGTTGHGSDVPEIKQMLEKLSGTIAMRKGTIVTFERPMKKRVLAKQIPAGLEFPVCDMETFGIAETCLRQEIRFLAFRAVSDTLDVEVPPELVGVVDESGEPRLGRLFTAVSTNPALVTDVLRLRRDSETAARNLGMLVEDLCRALS
jgi:nucleoside phosphorylase